MMKQIWSCLVVITITIFSVFTPTVKAEKVKIDYVALGDSLASGHTPYGEKIGRGFTDIISETLAKKDILASFTKEYAASGETSVGLLETLKRPEVQKSLKTAELVTIISGANDFIDAMYNPIDESINTDITKATTLLNTVAGNMTSAIQQVKTFNPEADIYIFGYYFPLPHLENTTSKQQMQLAFSIVNNRLATIAKNEGVHFVEVASAFDVNGASFLENPKDIHPNEEGYQVLADQFFLSYSLPVQVPSPTTRVMWGKTELKIGQIGKVTILEDTYLMKIEKDGSLSTIRILKKGEEYRVYSYKGQQNGLYGLGGGSFVQKSDTIRYETPSKAKLALLQRTN
ncbi:SGNH/GDSL hydrolase family protein [Psychrobacillus sp. NPDC096426]|uniref:SGNH/GDSL hydrolase family protein n=1 Tax=Psychrobacillus sp. NPDC096426 TaxID=3364491 RepID=UPI0037FB7A2D